jgi:hypothetical protein
MWRLSETLDLTKHISFHENVCSKPQFSTNKSHQTTFIDVSWLSFVTRKASQDQTWNVYRCGKAYHWRTGLNWKTKSTYKTDFFIIRTNLLPEAKRGASEMERKVAKKKIRDWNGLLTIEFIADKTHEIFIRFNEIDCWESYRELFTTIDQKSEQLAKWDNKFFNKNLCGQ